MLGRRDDRVRWERARFDRYGRVADLYVGEIVRTVGRDHDGAVGQLGGGSVELFLLEKLLSLGDLVVLKIVISYRCYDLLKLKLPQSSHKHTFLEAR